MRLNIFLVALLFLFSAGSFAQTVASSPILSAPVAAPSVSSSPVLVSVGAPAVSVANPASDAFLAQVVATIKAWGGLKILLRIAAIIALIIASMKVSIINKYVWSKLGAFQVYVAPLLGLIGGALSLGVSGPVTLASIFVYASAGAGAVFLHEILDSVKAIPGLGAVYVSLINLVENALGGPASQVPPVVVADASKQSPPA